MGSPHLAALRLARHKFVRRASDPCTVATQLGMAWLIEHGDSEGNLLREFVECSGNMCKLYSQSFKELGAFIAAYPEAASAIPAWTIAAAQPEALNPVPEFVGNLARILSSEGDLISQEYLFELLQKPPVVQQLLRNLVAYYHTDELQGVRKSLVGIAAAALTTAEDTKALIKVLATKDTNLVRVLPPAHLGKAMGLGLVSWETMTAWSMEVQRTPETLLDSPRTLGSVTGADAIIPRCMLERADRPSRTPSAASNPTGYERIQQIRREQGSLESDWADMRESHPVQDPAALQEQFIARAQSPMRGPHVNIMKFEATQMQDSRARRWEWWQTLAQAGFYIKAMYFHSQFSEYANSVSSGNKGQEVAKTRMGDSHLDPLGPSHRHR